jgi:glucokinase
VNGVPASGKSTVAREVSQELRAPLLTLDTVKESFFDHLGTGNRDYNRTLGKASYQAIFALIGDFPAGSITVVDAWFGFQPMEILQQHIERARLTRVIEVWCHAKPEVIGMRYLARAAQRPSGHLGTDYVPELIALAARASPTGLFPLITVDTEQADWRPGLIDRLKTRLAA